MNDIIINNKNYIDIAYQDKLLTEYTSSIESLINEVSKNYIKVGFYLAKAKKLNLQSLGYENIEEYGDKVFNLSRSTVYNMIGIAEKFCRWDGFYVNYPTLKDEFKSFNYSQLRELLTIDEIDVNRFRNMSVVKIQEIKILDKIQDFLGVNIERFLQQLNEKVIPILDDIANNIDLKYGKDDPMLYEYIKPYKGKEKCKEHKINYSVRVNEIRVSKEYKYIFKNDKGICFTLYFICVFYKDELKLEPYIEFNVVDYYVRSLINLKSTFSLDLYETKDDLFEYIVLNFKNYILEYKSSVLKNEKNNEKDERAKIDESLKKIRLMGDVSIKDISKEFAYKKRLKEKLTYISKNVEVDEKDVFMVVGSLYSEHIYFKVDDLIYYEVNNLGTVIPKIKTIYRRDGVNTIEFKTIENQVYNNEIIKFAINYIKENKELLKGEIKDEKK